MIIHKVVLRFLFCLTTLVVLAFSLGCGNSGSSKPAAKAAAAPTISVKSEQVVDDYIRDITTAENKYKNKNVAITGKVLHKGQFNNTPNFYIVTARKDVGGKQYTVDLYYPVSQVNEVNKLHQGDFVAAEGLCKGVVAQDESL